MTMLFLLLAVVFGCGLLIGRYAFPLSSRWEVVYVPPAGRGPNADVEYVVPPPAGRTLYFFTHEDVARARARGFNLSHLVTKRHPFLR